MPQVTFTGSYLVIIYNYYQPLQAFFLFEKMLAEFRKKGAAILNDYALCRILYTIYFGHSVNVHSLSKILNFCHWQRVPVICVIVFQPQQKLAKFFLITGTL